MENVSILPVIALIVSCSNQWLFCFLSGVYGTSRGHLQTSRIFVSTATPSTRTDDQLSRHHQYQLLHLGSIVVAADNQLPTWLPVELFNALVALPAIA
jgi:hypothetical protein